MREGYEGRKLCELTCKVCLFKFASSLICGTPVNIIILRAAAYSVRPIRNIAMEQRSPFLGCGERDGHEHGADSANDGVEEGGEGESIMYALELLDRFMEVDN